MAGLECPCCHAWAGEYHALGCPNGQPHEVWVPPTARLVNLTPHAIKVAGEDGETILEAAPSGQVARCTTSSEVVGEICGIEVVKTTFGLVDGLPPAEEGTIYIVSSLVAQAAGRDDVVAPDTGPTAIRDEAGRILAVKRFQRF